MKDERLYLVCYDVRDDRRWRRLYKTLRGYGEWIQLSVFQCRLTRRRLVTLEAAVREIIEMGEDHALIIDLGPSGVDAPPVKSIGLPYKPPARRPVIV